MGHFALGCKGEAGGGVGSSEDDADDDREGGGGNIDGHSRRTHEMYREIVVLYVWERPTTQTGVARGESRERDGMCYTYFCPVLSESWHSTGVGVFRDAVVACPCPCLWL